MISSSCAFGVIFEKFTKENLIFKPKFLTHALVFENNFARISFMYLNWPQFKIAKLPLSYFRNSHKNLIKYMQIAHISFSINSQISVMYCQQFKNAIYVRYNL